MMKKIIAIFLLAGLITPLFLLSGKDQANAETSNCSLSLVETKATSNKSISNFQNYLYSYYVQEKKYIGSDSQKREVLSCNLDTSFSNLNNIYSTLERLDQYIKVRDKKNFNLQTLKLQSQIKTFVSSMNVYKKSKADYEQILKTKKNTITGVDTNIKIDVTTPLDTTHTDSSQADATQTSDGLIQFGSKNDIFKRFSFDGKDSFIQTDSNGKIEYVLLTNKDQIKLYATQSKLDLSKVLGFYLIQEQKYGAIDLNKYPIKDYLSFEGLKAKFGGYVDSITYKVKDESFTDQIENLSQLINVPVTINGKSGIIGNQITKAYIFNSKDELELYFQQYASNEDLLKDFLVIRIKEQYYVTKVKSLDSTSLVKMSNNVVGQESQKDLFVKLDYFKNESFDSLTFLYDNLDGEEVEMKRDSVFTGVTTVFITYTDSSSYTTQLQDYLKSYTTLSFGSEIALYYNKVDNMKQLLKDKLSELSTYQYYAETIKNSSLDNGLFTETKLTGEQETIFKTYRWISENIVYDEKTKNDVIQAGSGKVTGQLSLTNNKSHYGIYTLKNKLGVCDGISILFADLLKINGINAKIVTGKDYKSGIGHALVQIGSEYYDPTNEIGKMKGFSQKTLVKGTEAFYKMPEVQLKTYFKEIKTKSDEETFGVLGDATIRTNIVASLKEILTANPAYIVAKLGSKDKALTTESTLTDKTDWATDFDKSDSIYKSSYFEYVKSKSNSGDSYLPFSLKKGEPIKTYFIQAYLQGYKYYYYHPVYNEIHFYKYK